MGVRVIRRPSNAGLLQDANSDRISVANQTLIDGHTNISFVVWFYLQSGWSGGRIFVHGPSGAGGGHQLILNSTGNYLDCFLDGGAAEQSATNSLFAEHLHMGVLTKDAGSSVPTLYVGINNELPTVSSGGGGSAATLTGAAAGRVINIMNYPGFNLGNTGVICLGALYYKKALTKSEIAGIWRGEWEHPDLLGAWRLNKFGTIYDMSGHRLHGTPSSVALKPLPIRDLTRDPFAVEPTEFIGRAPTGALIDFTAAADGVATASTVLSPVRGLGTSAAGVAAASVVISPVRSLDTAADGIAAASVTISPVRGLEVAPAGVGTATAALETIGLRNLTTTAAGLSTASVTIEPILRALDATAAGVASTTAGIDLLRNLGATADGAATAAAGISQTNTSTVTSAGLSSATAGILAIRSLTATSAGIATVTANTGAGITYEFTVAAAGVAGVTASIAATASRAVGKYAPEHASALVDLEAAKDFAAEHASALRDLGDAGV